MSHRSLRHAIKILEQFSVESYEYGVTEIARKLDMSIANVSRVVKTMEELGILRKNVKSRKYSLGSKLVDLTKAYLSTMDLKIIAQPYLFELNQKTQELITLLRMENEQCVLIDWLESTRSIRQAIHGPESFHPPFHALAPGKLLVSFYPDKQIDEILNRYKLVKYTDRTITDKHLFKEELREIRNTGLAMSKGEYLEHTFAVSAPIFDWTDNPVAAITISWLTIDDRPENLNEYTVLIKDVAERISKDMGYKLLDPLKNKGTKSESAKPLRKSASRLRNDSIKPADTLQGNSES